MKNYLNSPSSKIYKNGTALFLAGALMQGCASTNNKVNDVMSASNNDISSSSVTTSSTNNSNTNVDFEANPNTNSGELIFSKGGSRFNLGLEDSETLGLITSAEYSNVGNKWGTLITTEFGEKKQSYLVTGLYKGVDFSAKATAGYLKQDFEGVDIGQKYIGAEFLKDFSNIIENFRAGIYVNATQTDSKTLSVTQVSKDVEWGKEITTTTTSFEGQDTRSAGFNFEYDYDNNSFDANFGHTNIGDGANNYGVGYTYNGKKIRPSLKYSRLDGDSFDSEIYKGQVDYIISEGLSVGAAYKKVNSSTLDDNVFMILFSYTPGLKSYSNTREYNHMNLSHTTGAEQAMTTLYGQKETKVTKEVILDKSALDSKINEASALDKNDYTPNTWAVLASALSTAVIVNSDDDATLQEVKSAFNNLTSAINQLSQLANFGALNASISTAQSLNESDYTVNSWSNLESALTDAIQVRDNSNSNQSEIDQANTNLQSAISGLNGANTAPSQPNVSGITTVTIADNMNLSFSSNDLEGDSLTYRVISGNIPSGTTFDSSGSLSGYTNQVETGSFQVVANDGNLDSSPVTVNYNIEAYPIRVDIFTSGPIISGNNTDTVVASNGPLTDVEFNLSIYGSNMLSTYYVKFTPDVGTVTKDVDVLDVNGNIIGTQTLTVTWQ